MHAIADGMSTTRVATAAGGGVLATECNEDGEHPVQFMSGMRWQRRNCKSSHAAAPKFGLQHAPPIRNG